MTKDIYATPKSELLQETNEESELASRGKRLLASIIDGITMSVVTLPVMFFTGGFSGVSSGIKPSLGYNLFIALIGLFVYFILNGNLLIKKGQTIGKKLVDIKIVDLDGNLPTLKKHLLPRYGVYFLPGQVPIVGQLFSIINILFIFGKQKRCIHDYAGSTRVIAMTKTD